MSDISKRLEKAEKFLQKGKHDLALEEYLAIVREEPTNDKVREQTADLCVSQNRPEEAAALLGPLFDRQASIGDSARAIITYKKLARLAKPSVERSYKYAQLAERTNKKDALEAYEAALAGFVTTARHQEAAAALERIVALEPTVVNYVRQGDLARTMGDKPNAALAFYRAGDLEVQGGGDGLSKFERAYALDASNLDAALAYSEALMSSGDAAKIVGILAPLVAGPAAGRQEFRDLYGRALLAAKRPVEAEPLLWELFQREPRNLMELIRLMGALVDAGEQTRAIALSRKAEAAEHRAGRRREYVAAIRELSERHNPGIEFLEYLVELYNNASREQEYCSTLMKLFELYYAAGKFHKAAEALDRAAEVDPYETGHAQRLDRLRGKIDTAFFNSIMHRLELAAGSDAGKPKGAPDDEQPIVLEDFMLQAEIFLQYSMRPKALERLDRISKLFPYEEEKNPRLRQLYSTAGFTPNYEGIPRAVANAAAKGKTAGARTAVAAPARAARSVEDNSVDSIARVTEITRNIYRQTSVKNVLYTTVNEVGRHWELSRCVAGLCAPGKPPSAALEYCAPGVKQSDVTSVVKLISTLQALVKDKVALTIPNVADSPDLAPARDLLDALDVNSLVVIPLLDGEQQVGVLILEQCGRPRFWRSTDMMVLKTIADQAVQAFLNARLRSLVKTLAVTDEKSGLLKRASYVDVLLSEVRRSAQQSSSCTVMLFNFGKASTLVKESGEPAIEALMQQVGQVVWSHLRQTDIAVRYDLTTIAIVLSDTIEKNSFFVVDKLRRVVGQLKSPAGKSLVTTVGIAESAMLPGFDPVDVVTELINRAEAALAIAQTKTDTRIHALQPNLESAAVA
jgi:GGDEF domain-containing protein/tetratricopeptide (TPR) repeat protein